MMQPSLTPFSDVLDSIRSLDGLTSAFIPPGFTVSPSESSKTLDDRLSEVELLCDGFQLTLKYARNLYERGMKVMHVDGAVDCQVLGKAILASLQKTNHASAICIRELSQLLSDGDVRFAMVLERLKHVTDESAKFEQRFHKAWPRFDEAEIQRNLEAYRRGDPTWGVDELARANAPRIARGSQSGSRGFSDSRSSLTLWRARAFHRLRISSGPSKPRSI